MPLLPRCAARLLAGGALCLAALATPAQGSPAAPNLHRCDRTAYVVGDSRRTLEHTITPRTTDLIWAQQLGLAGSRRSVSQHVRYLAEPGAVHARFAADLAEAMAACSPGERPLVFDFMGTNYGVTQPERIGDPAFTADLERTILAFYDAAAPQARVVLAELTLDRHAGDDAFQAGVATYLDQYNGVLRHLAEQQPARFFFLPAPAVYDHEVTWRDAAHETADAPLAAYLAGDDGRALDRAGLAVVDAADGDTCALLDDERFGLEHNSELATLIAYLGDFRASDAARTWLADDDLPARSRLRFSAHDVTCEG
jgi:hypothetical protein